MACGGEELVVANPAPVDMAMGHLQEYSPDETNARTYAAPRGASPEWLKARVAARILLSDTGEILNG